MADYETKGALGGGYWDDLRFPATAINPVGQAAPPTLNTANGVLEFGADGVEVIAFQVQMPHSWVEGSAIRPHVHWRKKTEGTGDVVWRLTYEFANAGKAFTDSPETDSVHDAHPATADSGAALVHLITPFTEIDMTGFKISTMALMTLARVGSSDDDGYTGVAQLLEFDIHYLINQAGSVQEYVKYRGEVQIGNG